ncbi:MAG: ATP-binding protein [Pirellulaceae bacterium]|jgi:C4-dicarboxylate-specific signal transduction histidine kinase|nr:ATP-binding protein [Pirellulaceae bacterium]
MALPFDDKTRIAARAVALFAIGMIAVGLLGCLEEQRWISQHTEGLVRLIIGTAVTIPLAVLAIRAPWSLLFRVLVLVGCVTVLAEFVLSYTEDVAELDDAPIVGKNSQVRRALEPALASCWMMVIFFIAYKSIRVVQATHSKSVESIRQLEESRRETESTNQQLQEMVRELDETQQRLQEEIADRKQLEVEAHEQRERLAHVARLSTMGEMATGLAHELNQPLAAISNFCTAGKCALDDAGSTDTERLRGLFEKSIEQAMRAGEIIRRLRDFVRKSKPVRSSTDVTKLVDQMLRLFDSEFRHNDVRHEEQFEQSNRAALIDDVQIQQVLVNLIRNALDAMSDTERDRRTLQISTSATRDAMIEVAVRDAGVGVPNELADHVFDPFYSSKPGGMGMGLAISRTIIETHGGRLWMTPNSDRGVTVHFTLPMGDAAVDEAVDEACA